MNIVIGVGCVLLLLLGLVLSAIYSGSEGLNAYILLITVFAAIKLYGFGIIVKAAEVYIARRDSAKRRSADETSKQPDVE